MTSQNANTSIGQLLNVNKMAQSASWIDALDCVVFKGKNIAVEKVMLPKFQEKVLKTLDLLSFKKRK